MTTSLDDAGAPRERALRTRRDALRSGAGWLAGGLGAAALAACDPAAEPGASASAPPAQGAGGTGSGAAGAPDGAAPAAPTQGAETGALVVHTRAPLVCEARRADQGTVITPIERLFIRNNLPMPDPGILQDRDAWTLEVEGVERPGPITLGLLRRLGLTATAAVLQCSGNGRSAFAHGPSGVPWGCGGAGSALFAGLPVRALVERLGGPAPGPRRFLTARGADPLPEGLDPAKSAFERSIPLAKALEDGLLAWESNGAPLPLEHGGPLRLVVPGYFGVNHVKYVRRIALTNEESPSTWQQTSYRLSPVGERGGPEHPTQWAMPPKSWITAPLGSQAADAAHASAAEAAVVGPRVLVTGVAFGGARALGGVEVSADGGRTWRAAPLASPDLGPFAWRVFALALDLEPGTHRLASRARDVDGVVQPERRIENQQGYANNSWADLAVTIEVRA